MPLVSSSIFASVANWHKEACDCMIGRFAHGLIRIRPVELFLQVKSRPNVGTKERSFVGGEVRDEGASDWGGFMRRHWKAVGIFVLAGALALAGSVYVFLWFVKYAQSNGMVPATLGLWTMANLVAFILNAIFWELLLIGIPVGVGAVAGWLWWRRLPYEERRGYHFGRRSGATRGSGGVSLLFFIAFCIKIYLDGNWNVPIATWTLDYVVGSMVLILEWVLIIFGIPIAIGLIWWIRHKTRKGHSQTTS
jgi:hypothetical protein